MMAMTIPTVRRANKARQFRRLFVASRWDVTGQQNYDGSKRVTHLLHPRETRKSELDRVWTTYLHHQGRKSMRAV